MPKFDDTTCRNGVGDICIMIHFGNGMNDSMNLIKNPEAQSIYEGSLSSDSDVPAVVIDIPKTNRRMVCNIK